MPCRVAEAKCQGEEDRVGVEHRDPAKTIGFSLRSQIRLSNRGKASALESTGVTVSEVEVRELRSKDHSHCCAEVQAKVSRQEVHAFQMFRNAGSLQICHA